MTPLEPAPRQWPNFYLRRAALALSCLLLVSAGTACFAKGAQCTTAPQLLALPEPPADTPPNPYWQGDDKVDWYAHGFRGVGYLEADPLAAEGSWSWYQSVVPLYSAPGGDALGWLNRGWVTIGSDRWPLPPPAAVETGYAVLSVIISRTRDDGWLQILIAESTAGNDGRAWVHSCHLVPVSGPARPSPGGSGGLVPRRGLG